MRRTLAMAVALTLCVTGGRADARCVARDLYPTPPSRATSVPTNVKLFFTMYGAQREEAAKALAASAPALVAGRHRVALGVRVLENSAWSLKNHYLLLEPESELKPRRAYRLVVAKKPFAGPNLGFWRSKLSAYRIVTGAKPDRQKPSAPKKLASTGFRFARLGCGPSEQIGLRVAGLSDDQTPGARLRLQLDIVEKASKTRRRSLSVPPPRVAGEASLGHGMCSGNYKLTRGARYEIRVRAIDWAGNVSEASPAVSETAQTK